MQKIYTLQAILPGSRSKRNFAAFSFRLLILLVLCLSAGKGWGQIAAWQLFGALGTETTIAATTIDANLNIPSLARGSGLTASALANVFGSTNFTASGTKATAITGNKYILFTLNAKTGFKVSLTTLDVRFRRSGTGPNAFRWQYSTDGTNFTDLGSADISYTATTTGGDAQTQIDLSGVSALQNVTNSTTITIRLLGWGASAVGGTFAIGRSLTNGATDYSLAIGGTVTSVATPSIAISTPGIGATTEFQGATNVVLQRYDLAVTSAAATLNGLTVTTAGTYAAADLSNLKVRYSADAVLDGADATLSTKSTGLTAGSQVFPSFVSQAILLGATGYVFVTADIAATATAGSTINIDPTAFTNISFAGTVNKTGTDPVAAAGAKTFAVLLPDIAISGVSPVAGNINQNSTNNILYTIQLDVTTNNATLNSAAFTTAGTYQVADLQAGSFKLWINSSNSLSGATQLGTGQAIVISGNSISFTGLSTVISTGTTRYLLLTTDVAYNATAGNTVSITSTPFSSIVFASGNKTGTDPVGAGNAQTIVAVAPSVAISGSAIAAGSIGQNTVNNILYQASFAVTANSTNLTGITATTGGTYVPADIQTNGFKLWYNTVNTFSSATNISTLAVVSSGGNLVFTGLSQLIALSTTGYVWITTDISSGATVGNTINITSTAFSNILFNNGAGKTGTDPIAAGGLKTIQALPVAGEILINQLSGQYGAAADEYIELVNTTNKTFDLSLLKIGYQSAAGGTGTAGGTLSGTLLPHSFWLLSPNATVTVGLTSALVRDGSFTSGMAQGAGQIALLIASDNTKLDGVGYGTLTGGTFVETAAAASPTTGGGLIRITDGVDNNNNSTDFANVANANIYLRNSLSRLANTGASIVAGTYTDISVTGNSSISGNVTATNKLAFTTGAFSIGANTLTVNGAVTTVAGTLTGSSTSNLIIGGAAGTVNFTPGSQILKDLTINTGASATLGTALDITAGAAPGTVTVTGTLNTAGLLTIKSNATGTARVGASTGTISGNVTVERYVQGHRAWRFITAPIAASGAPSINASWQEGAVVTASCDPVTPVNDPHPGFGTHITGGTTGNLFDQNPAGNPSAKKTVEVWAGISNTSDAVTTEEGYMVFVRGSRGNILCSGTGATAVETVLRVTGTLKQGTKTYTHTLASAGPKVIGNPYASAITMPFYMDAPTNAIPIIYSVWDPLLTGTNSVGGFVQYSSTGSSWSLSITPVSPLRSGIVESGSAFTVQYPAGTNTLTLGETDKTTGSVVSQLTQILGEQMRINLNKVNANSTVSLQDGMLTEYDTPFSDLVNAYDAVKVTNFTESMSSKRDGTKLAIERRAVIVNTDTSYLDLIHMTAGNYQLELIADNLNHPNLLGKLVDNYTSSNTVLSLHGSSTYAFTVDANAGSFAADRFKVVYYAAGPLPVTFTSIKATQQNKNIAVEWQVANQVNISKYEVEKSTDGRHFTTVATQQPVGINGANATYNWLDVNAVTGDHFYRISSAGLSGDIKLSSIVKVTIGKGIPAIVVYPNPVVNNTVTLQFTDMPKGDYSTRLINMLGQTVQSKQLTHSGSNTTQSFAISQGIAKGNYQLQIITPAGEKLNQKIVITE